MSSQLEEPFWTLWQVLNWIICRKPENLLPWYFYAIEQVKAGISDRELSEEPVLGIRNPETEEVTDYYVAKRTPLDDLVDDAIEALTNTLKIGSLKTIGRRRETGEYDEINGLAWWTVGLTRQHRTRGGGRHILFQMPQDDIGCSASKLHDGVDVRANGGFEAGQFTNRLPWLLAQIDSIEGLAAVFLDPGSDIYCDNFYDPVLVKRFCRTLNIEAFKRGITIFLGLHTAKGGEGNKTPFGSMQWLGATRATLVLDHVIGEDGRPTHEEAVLRVHKGNYMRPGDEIELVWQDGLLVPKDAPGGQDQLARLAELDTLIERLVTEAWEVSAPLSDNRSQGDRYLPAKIRQASKGRFSHKEAKQQMEDHLRLGRLVITRCSGSRRIGLKVAETGGHDNQCVGGHRKD